MEVEKVIRYCPHIESYVPPCPSGPNSCSKRVIPTCIKRILIKDEVWYEFAKEIVD